jgi:hypothetical protein
MATIVFGKTFVFGVPKILKRVSGIPDGARCRFRFRDQQLAKVFVQVLGFTTVHRIEIDGGFLTGAWRLGPAIGLNQKS